MATIQSIKNKIQGLIDKSNEATGGSDTDLTTAIDNLIANQGGDNSTLEYNDEWINDVVFWDYDGTMVARYSIEEANALTELPTPPSHDGLTFQSWNHTLEEIKTTDHILDVGATYIPSDGKTHIHINITSTSSAYLKWTVKFTQTIDNGVTIDWGDGKSETFSGVDALISAVHSYTTKGEYVITFDVSDGCTMTLGDGSAMFITTGSTSNIKKFFIGKNIALTEKSLYNITANEILTLPNGYTEIPKYCFQYMSRVRALILPNGVTRSNDNGLALGSSVDVTYGYYERVVSLPLSIKQMGNFCNPWDYYQKRCILPHSLESLPKYAFSNASWARVHYYNSDIDALTERMYYRNGSLKKYTCKQGVTEIPQYTFYETFNLEEFTANNELKAIGNGNLYNVPRLKKLSLNEGLETIGTNFLANSNVKNVVIPSTVTLIGSSFLNYSSVEKLVIKGADTTIDASSSTSLLYNSKGLREIFFLSPTPPPCATKLLSSTINGIFGNSAIAYVNDDSYDDYKAVSSSYAKLAPLSKYTGEKFWE